MSEFVIPIRIRDEQALYAPFDPAGLSFSGKFTDYLSGAIPDRKPGERVLFEITSDGPFDGERFQNAYALLISTLRRRNRRDMAKCHLSAVRLLLIGILFIMIGLALAPKLKEILAAIISTIGSFSVWEAAARWIETLPALIRKEKVLNVLEKAAIRTIGGNNP